MPRTLGKSVTIADSVLDGEPQGRVHGRFAKREADRTCSVNGCAQRHYGRGLCHGHYLEVRKTEKFSPGPCRHCRRPMPVHGFHYCGDECRQKAQSIREAAKPRCSSSGCASAAKTRGMCYPHYKRAKRVGQELPHRECPECRVGRAQKNRRYCSEGCHAQATARQRSLSAKRFRARHPEKAKAISRGTVLRMLYGLSVEQYEAMLKDQGAACAICGKTNRSGRRLSVDHDHATGAIRGLLCAKCNQGLGLLQDSPELLGAAAAYLIHHRTKEVSACLAS